MRNLIATLIAVSVLGVAAVPASALDARHFFDQQDRISGGGTL
jgi:hypothetical protein